MAFVVEGNEGKVFSGRFWAYEGGGHFQDIIDGSNHQKVIRWRPDSTGLSAEEREQLLTAHRTLRQELRNLIANHPDTQSTAERVDAVADRMDAISRKLGAREPDE